MSDTVSPSPPPPSPPGPPGPHLNEQIKVQAKGFAGSLLDFSFEHFVTPTIIKVIYGLMLLGVALGALMFLVTSIAAGSAVGVLIGLIGAAIMLVLGAVFARVYVEIIMLAFKILETLQRIESKLRQN